MTGKITIPPGQAVRVLFNLTQGLCGQSTAEFFASRILEVQVPPSADRVAVTVRVAPYVVGSFGEAFLMAQMPLSLTEGAPVAIWEGDKVVADALVAKVTAALRKDGLIR